MGSFATDERGTDGRGATIGQCRLDLPSRRSRSPPSSLPRYSVPSAPKVLMYFLEWFTREFCQYLAKSLIARVNTPGFALLSAHGNLRFSGDSQPEGSP
eukprot:1329213-Amorphochlora_amoeboformis.AAC.2